MYLAKNNTLDTNVQRLTQLPLSGCRQEMHTINLHIKFTINLQKGRTRSKLGYTEANFCDAFFLRRNHLLPFVHRIHEKTACAVAGECLLHSVPSLIARECKF